MSVGGFLHHLRLRRWSIRTEEREFHRIRIYRPTVAPEAELLPETREVFRPVWDRLAMEPDNSATGNELSRA